jgi:hypothetical protein
MPSLYLLKFIMTPACLRHVLLQKFVSRLGRPTGVRLEAFLQVFFTFIHSEKMSLGFFRRLCSIDLNNQITQHI